MPVARSCLYSGCDDCCKSDISGMLRKLAIVGIIRWFWSTTVWHSRLFWFLIKGCESVSYDRLGQLTSLPQPTPVLPIAIYSLLNGVNPWLVMPHSLYNLANPCCTTLCVYCWVYFAVALDVSNFQHTTCFLRCNCYNEMGCDVSDHPSSMVPFVYVGCILWN